MAQFSYIARSRTGEKIEGMVDANDRRAALVQIEHMGHVPVSVHEGGAVLGGDASKNKTKRPLFSFSTGFTRRKKMKLRDVLLYTREMTDLLLSGMTLGNALHTLSRREDEKGHNQIVAEMRDEIIQGASLSDCLSRRPETFSELYVSMVKAGEASGTLAEVLERLVFHYERVLEAKEKVLMALVYPAIVLSMGFCTIIFTMIFVVPRFNSIFEELGSQLPLPTQILIGLSGVLLKYGWLIAIAVVVGTILFRRGIKTTSGRRWWHRLVLRMPVVKKIIYANAFAHFARTLGALLANGVPVLQALTIVEDTVGNVVIAREIKEARDRVTDGATISGPLASGKIFPPLLTDMLAVGEESGDMSGALLHISKRYDDDLDRAVKVLTTVMEPFLILFMAVMVGFVAISMLLAVFDLTSGLNM